MGNQMEDLSFSLMSCETYRKIFNLPEVYFSHLKMGTICHATTKDLSIKLYQVHEIVY